MSDLQFNLNSNNTGGPLTVTVMKNEAVTAISCVIPNGQNSCTDSVDQVTYNSGDRLNISTHFASGATASIAASWTLGPGLPGATGPQGPMGATGANGATGATGVGVTGATGVQGVTGALGATGATGVNAFTTTSANFTQPAANASTGSIAVTNSSWIAVGQVVFIQTGGYYTVTAKADTAHVTLTWLGNGNTVGQGGTVANGSTVSAAGLQGPTGPQGATGSTGPQGATGATGIQGLTGATGVVGPDRSDRCVRRNRCGCDRRHRRPGSRPASSARPA